MCEKGSNLEKGVRLVGAAKRKFRPAKSLEELTRVYEKFEAARVQTAQRLTKRNDIAADPFCKFVVEKTDICPHKLITPLSNYWLETVYIMDGDMGVSLPAPLDEVPAVFFDALSIVRNGKNMVNKEEKDRK